VAYTVGQIVTYNGARYQCRQAHTSIPGWEPPNVLALWLPI
jgi:chitinase